MKKRLILIAAVLTMTIALAACQKTDVIGNTSIKSFEDVINAMSDNVEADDLNGGWTLKAPDESARFVWSKDFSKSPSYDVFLEIDSQPFLDAGLDVSKLPDGYLKEDKIIVGTDLGDDVLTYKGEATPLESYKKIVELKRDSITYHTAMDHYGVDLGNGNVFEWAKDMSENDKDIVFVLDPQVFIDAGVDPEKIEGWAFAEVETMDMSGKDITVEKLLKPFEIQN